MTLFSACTSLSLYSHPFLFWLAPQLLVIFYYTYCQILLFIIYCNPHCITCISSDPKNIVREEEKWLEEEKEKEMQVLEDTELN